MLYNKNVFLEFLNTLQELYTFFPVLCKQLAPHCCCFWWAIKFMFLSRKTLKLNSLVKSTPLLLQLDTRKCTCLLYTLIVFSCLYYINYWAQCRVTCRDWFQLSLKEGLTVFRDQVGCILWEDRYTNIFVVALTYKFLNDSCRSSHLIWEAVPWKGLLMFQSFECISTHRFQRVLSSSCHYNIPASYIYTWIAKSICSRMSDCIVDD